MSTGTIRLLVSARSNPHILHFPIKLPSPLNQVHVFPPRTLLRPVERAQLVFAHEAHDEAAHLVETHGEVDERHIGCGVDPKLLA
jgi:hypothetical protein